MPVSEYDENLRARDVRVTEDSLTVRLVDGRSISAPLEWYPRLHRATPAQRTIMLIEGLPSIEHTRARTG